MVVLGRSAPLQATDAQLTAPEWFLWVSPGLGRRSKRRSPITPARFSGLLSGQAPSRLRDLPSVTGHAPKPIQIASMVEGGFRATLYVTLTMSGTSRMISRASCSRRSNESRVGVAVRASTLSQQRTSIC